jgi:hypothetical protein
VVLVAGKVDLPRRLLGFQIGRYSSVLLNLIVRLALDCTEQTTNWSILYGPRAIGIWKTLVVLSMGVIYFL